MKNERGKVKLITLIGIVLVLAIILFSLVVYKQIKNNEEKEATSNNNTAPSVSTQDNPVANVNENSNFSMKFLQLENNQTNMIYSPLSIRYALKMLQDGADNNTYSQIEKVIGNANLPTYKNIDQKLSLANGIYIRDTYKQFVKQDYINTLKTKYDAEVQYDKFENATNVNKWIEDKTLGIIKNMLKDEVVKNPDMKMLLINALAIDMGWKSTFDFKDTHGREFYLDDGNKLIVTMMSQENSTDGVSYYISNDLTALTMDLKDEEDTQLEFMAIMPNKNLKEYIENIKEEDINEINQKLTLASKNQAGVKINIPKFSFDYNLNLKNDLNNMGITDAFNEEKADFSKMVDLEKIDGNTYVEEALHKANIDFSEKGIKAAAVTIFSMMDTASEIIPQEPEVININKPFLFLIRDKNTKEIWFTGTVYEPNLWENDKQNYNK